MAQVSIIGSGNVGANTAFFIAETGIEDVLLYDIQAGLSTGKALDMMEAAPIRKYRNRLRGTDRLEEIAGSEVVVLAAGLVRKPGMKREDLFAENCRLVQELAPRVAHLAPQAKVIVATEPVDPITAEFVRLSGLPRKQVMGIGGCLDATRLRYLIARDLGVSMENVSAMVIGRHADSMIVLPRYCSVSGVPLTQLASPERIRALIEETVQAGDLIVSLAQRSSAFYAPSAAAADLVNSIHMNLRRILCVSLVLEGEYGLQGVAMSLPAVIGQEGIVRVLTPRLASEELEVLKRSAAELAALAAVRPAEPAGTGGSGASASSARKGGAA